MKNQPEFLMYRAGSEVVDPKDVDAWLANPPPWRKLADVNAVVRKEPIGFNEADARRGKTYVCSGNEELLRVNIALSLRRPLLVSGAPGLGKSTLAYNIAWTLGLGAPLRWEVNSQTTLKDGLYSYDAVDHLRATQESKKAKIGEFITLGPLGTALLPTERPRVLLIDELDKATFDLPNDLLHVFEEGAFTIPELVRLGKDADVYPSDARDKEDTVTVKAGRIQSKHHPVVVITDNGERTFSEAFRRRCVPLKMARPDEQHMQKIVTNLLGQETLQRYATAAEKYHDQATDVLLQALFLENQGLDAGQIFEVLKR